MTGNTYKSKDGITLNNVPVGTPEDDIKARFALERERRGGQQNPIGARTAEKQTEDYLAGLTSSEMERALLGEQFAKPTQVNDYELDDPSLRFKLSRIESAPDAVNLLQKSLPEGDMAVALEDPNGGRVLGFVRPPKKEGGKSQFFRIDSPNEFSVSDIADFGNLASLETVMSVASAFAPAKGIAQKMVYEFVAAFSGKTADEVIDQMSGLEDQTAGDVVSEATEAGAINVMGGRIADIGARAGNLAMGRGFRSSESDEMTMRRQEALDAGVRQGLRSAPVQGGLGQRATAISERLGSGIPGRRGVEGITTERRGGVADKLQEEAFGRSEEGALEMEIAQLGDTGLLNLISQAKGRAEAGAVSAANDAGFPFKLTTKEEGGQSVFKGMDDFSEKTRNVSDKAYDDYFELVGDSGIVYNVSPLIREAEDALRVFRLQRKDIEIDGGVLPGGDVAFGQGLEARFRTLAKDIASLKEVQDRDPLEVTQALRQIRTQLIDLSEIAPGAGTKTNSQRLSTKMLNTLHEEVLTNPQGVEAEGVAQAFEKANKLWKDRTRVLNAFAFSKAKRGEIGSGEKLYNALTGDMTEEVAKAAKAQLPKEEFERFQAALITDMMRSPERIPQRLQALGRSGEILVPKEMRNVLDIYRRNMLDVDAGILNELFMRQAQDAHTVSEIVERGSVQDLSNLVSQGVIESNDLRKLIFQDALNATTTFSENRLQINPLEFTGHVEKLKNGKFWGMLSQEQRNLLSDLEIYASFLQASDSGSSIAAAEIAARQLQPLTNPIGAVNARAKQIQIGIAAEISNSDMMAKILAGRGEVATPMRNLRAGVIFTVQAINKAIESESAKDLPEAP